MYIGYQRMEILINYDLFSDFHTTVTVYSLSSPDSLALWLLTWVTNRLHQVVRKRTAPNRSNGFCFDLLDLPVYLLIVEIILLSYIYLYVAHLGCSLCNV